MQKCCNTNMHYFWPWPYITANDQPDPVMRSVNEVNTEHVYIWMGVCVRSLLRGQITYVECLCELPPWWRADTAYLSLTQADLHTEPGISDPDGQEASQPLSSNTISHLYTCLHLHLTHHCASLELQRFLTLLCLSIWTFSLSLPGQSRWTVGLHSGSIKTNRKKQQEWWS